MLGQWRNLPFHHEQTDDCERQPAPASQSFCLLANAPSPRLDLRLFSRKRSSKDWGRRYKAPSS